MKNDEHNVRESAEERPFTFKITKRRSPWTNEEDQAISGLVKKHGTGNWTLIANEMADIYGFKNRSGKQCRERWHNHLDPNINKDYWSEKEENILFMKHIEYGNKWSDIAKFLPGRTDNAIKNHFYSKLRKFIRKILKLINKDNLLKNNGIDVNKYNSDKVYKIIKKFKIPYNTLTKDSILSLIINFDKNSKNGKLENAGNLLLKQKTTRKKSVKEKENLYSEKVNKRKNLAAKAKTSRKEALKAKEMQEYSESESELGEEEEESNEEREYDNDVYSVKIHKKAKPFKKLSRRNLRERKNENFERRRFSTTTSNEISSYNRPKKFLFADAELNNFRDSSASYGNNFNIVINKNILEDNFDREKEKKEAAEDERNYFQSGKKERKGMSISACNSLVNSTRNLSGLNKQFNFNSEIIQDAANLMSNINEANYSYGSQQDLLNPQIPKSNINMRQKRVLNIDTNVPATLNQTITPFANKNYQDYFLLDANKPLISPLNYHPHMFPVSTKNHFNINMDPMLLQNLLETPTNFGGFPGGFRIPAGGEAPLLNQTKEVSMQDKILINEPENNNNNNKNNFETKFNKSAEENKKSEAEKNVNHFTPKFKEKTEAEEALPDKSLKDANSVAEFDLDKRDKQKQSLEDAVAIKPKDSSSKRFLIDLDVVNQSDTTKIFAETVSNYKNEPSNLMRFSDQENLHVKESPRFKSFSTPAEEQTNTPFKTHPHNIFVTTSESGSIPAQQHEHKKVIFSTVHAPQPDIHIPDRTKANQTTPGNGNEADRGKAAKAAGDKMELNNIDTSTLNNNVEDKQRNLKLEFLKNKYNKIIPMISPTRASLNISPKSAFVVNKKLFN